MSYWEKKVWYHLEWVIKLMLTIIYCAIIKTSGFSKTAYTLSNYSYSIHFGLMSSKRRESFITLQFLAFLNGSSTGVLYISYYGLFVNFFVAVYEISTWETSTFRSRWKRSRPLCFLSSFLKHLFLHWILSLVINAIKTSNFHWKQLFQKNIYFWYFRVNS